MFVSQKSTVNFTSMDETVLQMSLPLEGKVAPQASDEVALILYKLTDKSKFEI